MAVLLLNGSTEARTRACAGGSHCAHGVAGTLWLDILLLSWWLTFSLIVVSVCARQGWGGALGDMRPHAGLLACSLHSSSALLAISKLLSRVGRSHGGCLRVPVPPDTPQPWAPSGVTASAVSVALRSSLGASNGHALGAEMRSFSSRVLASSVSSPGNSREVSLVMGASLLSCVSPTI